MINIEFGCQEGIHKKSNEKVYRPIIRLTLADGTIIGYSANAAFKTGEAANAVGELIEQVIRDPRSSTEVYEGIGLPMGDLNDETN